eukprot:scaffold41746_cov67-Phaeocystis_antarctica.AAC.10
MGKRRLHRTRQSRPARRCARWSYAPVSTPDAIASLALAVPMRLQTARLAPPFHVWRLRAARI